jgi:hypothetical protein
MSPETDPAVVRVVRGNPTAEELAIPVAVLASVGGSSALESSVTEETLFRARLGVAGGPPPVARVRNESRRLARLGPAAQSMTEST